MPTLVNAETDEREALLSFLAAQRGGLRRAVHGLTEEQAASTPTVSALSLTVLIKHAARCERFWIVDNLQGGGVHATPDENDWAEEYRLAEGETLAAWLDTYEQVATETEKIIRELPDLAVDFPLPTAPWFPPNSRRTARWVLLHLIQEGARHAGHADIIRETLDGKTAFELVDETGAA
ncbi:DinB family protein [Kitasatospora sp. MBT63]|uniref:DinB family protein n=1 Tax=Kitasatospora sp. MBT63 TaxID=1444768 RepID=UPI00053B10A1|nr:DinB family protein [Kitasatospora sp. MBT63]